MVKCKNCGTEIEENMKYCKKCGAEITTEEENQNETQNENQTTEEKKFCANCGCEMPKTTKFCPECGASTDKVQQPVNNTNQAVVNTNKSPGLAAILSFLIVGLGQIYLGLSKKGIILFIAAVVSVSLMFFIIGFITWFIVWIYAIYDAYNSGEKMRNGIAVKDTIDMDNLF